MKARRTWILVGLLAFVTLGLVLPVFQVCRDWGFIDRNTGSRKGYRDWFLGWRSGSWYHESPVETFMRSKHPAEFRQDWVSYMGTGRNIFGGSMLTGHGRPGPIIFLKPELIADYCRSASEVDKRRLYDVFASGEKDKIRELIEQISEGTVRTGAGSGKSGEQAAPTSYGQAMERQVRIRTWWAPAEHDVLNLDDGQLMAVPTNIVMGSINNPRPLLTWMAKQGADLDVTTGNSLTNLSLHLDDGRLAVLGGNVAFDSVTASDIGRQLAERSVFQHVYIPKPEKGAGAVLAFKTREGGVGVLQVFEVTPEEHPMVKIRYKLLQRRR